jgi:large subunit ribosomal protein L17
MRHRVGHRKLRRKTEHRLSLLRNLAAALIVHERVRTTLAKAKELRPFAERLITLGKRETLAARRQALRVVPRGDAVSKLFSQLSARFADRRGGYTRILKLGPRSGDGTPMALIELVDFTFTPTSRESKEKKDKKSEGKTAAEPSREERQKKGPEAKARPETKDRRADRKTGGSAGKKG